jgi:ligand-binding sensor domain-containing protein
MERKMRTLKISLLVFILQITITSQNFWEPLTSVPDGYIETMLIDELGIIYVGTYFGDFYISFDNGISWIDPNINCSIATEDITLHPNSDVFVADHGCINRSTDNGTTWELFKLTFQCRTVYINSLEYIFSGEEMDWNVGRLWRSTDNGLTWEHYELPYFAVVYSIDSDSIGNLYAGTTHGTFISTNNGDSWSNNQLTSNFIPSIIITKNNSALAGTWGEGIYRSTNLGSSWEQTSLTILQIRDFISDQNGFVWAATDSGIFKSTDDGVNWLLVENSGLTNYNISAIAIDPEGFIVVGADSGKVFRTVESTTDVKKESFLHDFSLSQNYPNPFNPSTVISYQLPVIGFVTLKVYDILGREVATLVNEEKPAGEYEVEFDGSNLTCGIYFYQLKAGEFAETKKMILLK